MQAGVGGFGPGRNTGSRLRESQADLLGGPRPPRCAAGLTPGTAAHLIGTTFDMATPLAPGQSHDQEPVLLATYLGPRTGALRFPLVP